MPFCTFADNNPISGVTPVDNLFFLEYMAGAPGEFIKVYLYGLMMCRYPNADSGIEAMSKELNLDVSVIENAYGYWEREGLVVRTGDNPLSYNYLPLRVAPGSALADQDDEIYKNRSFNRDLQSLMPTLILDGHELRMASDWIDVLHLDEETVLFMVKREVDKRGGKLPTVQTLFRHLNDTAVEWANEGVTDVPSAEKYLARSELFNKTACAVINRFGMKRSPSDDESALCKKWLEEYHLTPEEILASCAETVKANNPSFGYLDSVLRTRISSPVDGEFFELAKQLNANLGISARVTPSQLDCCKVFREMGFADDVIKMAAAECGSYNRRTYEDIEKRLTMWKDAGAMTVAEIEEERQTQRHFTDLTNEIFAHLGIDRKVIRNDIKLVKIWTALLPTEVVYFAADCAAGTENPMKYIDKLVQVWSATGINTVEKAQQQYESHKVKVKTSERNYDQRTVSEKEFEDSYYLDLSKYSGDESK